MKLLRELKGVGEKTEKLLAKAGLRNTGDLLRYYPRRYEAYEAPVPIRAIAEGTVCTVRAQVMGAPAVNTKSRIPVTSVIVQDATGKLSLIWFRAPYIRSILKRGCVFFFRGRIGRRGNALQMEQPEILSDPQYEALQNSLQPVYGLTAGLSNKTLQKLVRQVMEETPHAPDFLPPEVRERYQLAEEGFSLEAIHFPRNRESLLTARRRLVFDEFLLFILSVNQLKEKSETAENQYPMKPVWTTENVIDHLPYQLTGAQQNVWHEIERDLTGHTLMTRLVQGDVGSGKTILAFLAMILTAENGYQSALMVPTEVLANQHFEALTRLLTEMSLEQYSPVLLTGSQTAKEKREIYGKIASGETKMVVGTHALIQEKVQYARLGLAVTDEQHRFGVRQRESLSVRGGMPHVLVMSATPIPRTLALILFGDLDISVLDELPASRLPVKNCVVSTGRRPTAWNFIQREAEAGHQCYVICPQVSGSEEMEAENVTDYSERLKEALPDTIRVHALHGKMRPKEKNSIMERFAAGEIDVLVSTTVIEVGVNVPNATVMMVENAERFGLAQLHQLRGRVGRGSAQSYCIFVQGNEDSETGKRLEILTRSNDGFAIAGEDLKLRGPGDVFGIRQSGVMEFRLGDIYQDAEILKKASEASAEILSLDPELSLPQNGLLRRRLDLYMEGNLQNLTL